MSALRPPGHPEDCACWPCCSWRQEHGPRGFADKVAGTGGICTKAERELLECLLASDTARPPHIEPIRKTLEEHGWCGIVDALEAVIAERQPKTPEQDFEERIRYVLLSFDAYSERWENDDHKQSLQWASAAHKLRAALGALDHARAELKREGKPR